jgi:hypothetical protein
MPNMIIAQPNFSLSNVNHTNLIPTPQVEDAMLSKIEDVELSLRKERDTSSALRSDCERMRIECHHLKEEARTHSKQRVKHQVRF